jgi:CubicO group peptidase (beta-lactamase class C family)
MVGGVASLGGLQQFGAPYAQVQGRTTRYDRAAADARKLLVTFMQENGVPGMSVAIGVNGDIVWSEGLGLADVEQSVPVTSLTRFRSGSVSKAITSTAAAVLYQRGQLDYDAPIQKYVPSFPDKGHVITPRMLAGHLAGIKYYTDGGDDFYSTKRYRDVMESLEIFDQAPLVHPPGT